MEIKRKIRAPSGIRNFCVCQNQRIFMAVVYDMLKIYDTQINGPINSIKLESSPRLVQLSPNGNYIVTYQQNNFITIYDTFTATILERVFLVPSSIKKIRFSKNSQKLIYGSSQTLCLFNIKTCQLQMRTQNWKNINCYDLNQTGNQFCIGTFNGTIYVITYLGNGRCTQVQIQRHQNCVIVICYHINKIISISYDGLLLISTLSNSQAGERIITYNQIRISYVPRDIESIGDNFYLIDSRGITWMARNYVLVGILDSKPYKPLVNENGQLIFVKLGGTQIEWLNVKHNNNPTMKSQIQ